MLPESPPRPGSLAVARSLRGRVRLLLEGGDRAHAHGDAPALAHVARELIAHVPRSLQYELVAITELASLNFDVARRRWVELSRRLRERAGNAAHEGA